MTATATQQDPALNIGALSLNDCRTVCRALKLRASELRKLAKKATGLDRPTEAASIEREAADIQERLGPRFDEQGTFNFGTAKEKPPQDEAEAAHRRLKRGGR
jgi:hypothetical protein